MRFAHTYASESQSCTWHPPKFVLHLPFHGATFALLKKGTLQKLLLSISEYLYMHKCCIDMQRTSETTWFRRHVHFYAVPPRRLVAIFYFVGRDLDAS